MVRPLDGGYTPESWDRARDFAGSLGPYPSSFTSVIRLLNHDRSQNTASLSDITRFLLGRLLRSSTIQASYYYAVRAFRPERLAVGPQKFTLADFIDSFTGEEHAVMLTCIYLFRTSRLRCKPGALDKIQPRLFRHSDLGFLVGSAIPTIGAARAMLFSSMRVFALIPFIKFDAIKFGDYWIHLHKQGARYTDPVYEFDAWECNSSQIAVLLSQQFGFGVQRSVDLMYALSVSGSITQGEAGVRSLKFADIWINSLLRTGGTPDIPLPPEFYPDRLSLEALIERASLAVNATAPHWLIRTKHDISPEKAPELAFDTVLPSVASSDQLPEALQGALEPEAIEEISDRFIDEIEIMPGGVGEFLRQDWVRKVFPSVNVERLTFHEPRGR